MFKTHPYSYIIIGNVNDVWELIDCFKKGQETEAEEALMDVIESSYGGEYYLVDLKEAERVIGDTLEEAGDIKHFSKGELTCA